MTNHVRRYETGGRIACGGMAEILAACAVSQPGVSKRVALKRIRTDRAADPVFVARFFDEARLAMQLSHANVVQVFDFGRLDEGEFFLAMEFVEGVDLQRLRKVEGHDRLTPAEALHVTTQVLRGLDYAHRRTTPSGQPLNIVHLDVKPANVLLSFEGEVKLTDFGVARSRDARRPNVGISGTIPFMAPEQARGERVDARSDVFSAGLLLHALLTGAAPLGEEDDEETLERVRAGVVEPSPDLPLALRILLVRALAPAARDRFPTAGAFADALEETVYAEGWRGGAAALRERLAQAFPGERERLNALFDSHGDSEEFAVASEGTDQGTLLSRLTDEPPLEVPKRQTVLAELPPPRRFGVPVLAGVGAGLVLLGGLFALRPSATDLAGPDAAAVPPDAAPAPTPQPAPGPDASEPAGPDAATAAPPEPRAERPALGTLTVNATPWGTVSVNGRTLGPTPLLRHPLRAGTATVVIENPKFGRRVIPVKIQAGKETPLFVDLRATGERP